MEKGTCLQVICFAFFLLVCQPQGLRDQNSGCLTPLPVNSLDVFDQQHLAWPIKKHPQTFFSREQEKGLLYEIEIEPKQTGDFPPTMSIYAKSLSLQYFMHIEICKIPLYRSIFSRVSLLNHLYEC